MLPGRPRRGDPAAAACRRRPRRSRAQARARHGASRDDGRRDAAHADRGLQLPQPGTSSERRGELARVDASRRVEDRGARWRRRDGPRHVRPADGRGDGSGHAPPILHRAGVLAPGDRLLAARDAAPGRPRAPLAGRSQLGPARVQHAGHAVGVERLPHRRVAIDPVRRAQHERARLARHPGELRLQRRTHLHDRRRDLLRGGGHARDVPAVRSLDGDARPARLVRRGSQAPRARAQRGQRRAGRHGRARGGVGDPGRRRHRAQARRARRGGRRGHRRQHRDRRVDGHR